MISQTPQKTGRLTLRPKPANQLAPRRRIVGATATVSTLVTVVGQPKTPTLAGNGGFRRGLPWRPCATATATATTRWRQTRTTAAVTKDERSRKRGQRGPGPSATTAATKWMSTVRSKDDISTAEKWARGATSISNHHGRGGATLNPHPVDAPREYMDRFWYPRPDPIDAHREFMHLHRYPLAVTPTEPIDANLNTSPSMDRYPSP